MWNAKRFTTEIACQRKVKAASQTHSIYNRIKLTESIKMNHSEQRKRNKNPNAKTVKSKGAE